MSGHSTPVINEVEIDSDFNTVSLNGSTHRHGHVGPAPVADFRTGAARSHVVVICQVDIENQLPLYRLERARLDREMVLGTDEVSGESANG